MKLDKKKALAAKIFKVGKDRIVFLEPRLEEIKEAITKDDIRSLKADGAIMIKEIKARRSKPKRKAKRSPGNIRKRAKDTKREYMTLTRKFRSHVAKLKEKKVLDRSEVKDLRNKIRNRYFKSQAQLRDYIGGLKK
jgi:large subunit ribosomal protein L19e